ncbi:hypothetical protein L1765_11900 [Microaerobacter geothermalis]|uniref:YkvI family membrane protein n=1 Tax=Microaerobacter geothermalis TaxID=674972 RepID=UPI001F2E6C5F|nr:hypothetical protein [Microaerobacter geothermalis]MCF6094664.1 hypothetical protein [Microaerobacter geothermalis]
MDSWNRGIKIGLTIVGTTIGAGFASGRELWEFFSSYGEQSVWGILIAIFLFTVSSMTILWLSWKYQSEHYFHVLEILMGKRVAYVFDGIILFYLFTVTVVMFAGSGAAFFQWDMTHLSGVLFIAVLVYIVLLFNVEGIISLNTYIVPMLMIILLVIPLQFLIMKDMMLFFPTWTSSPVWTSAITYASLNIVPLVAVLSTFGTHVKQKKEIMIAGLVGGLSLGTIAILLNQALLINGEKVIRQEIPLFSLVDIYPSYIIFLVTIILWIAIYTTAVSSLHGLIRRIKEWIGLPIWLLTALLIVFMITLSQFGFSVLVKVLYPLYGVLNLFVLMVILLYPISGSVKKE